MPRPSLAHVATIAFFALVAFPRASIPLIDGDVWWHIRAGLEVLSSGRVASVDSWSIVGAGQPWTSQDWLSNVGLALIHGPDPTSGIGAMLASLAYAGLVVVALLLLWIALGLRGARGWVGRILWLAAGLTVAGPTIGVRVQVVDLTLAAATLLLLWGHLSDGRRGWLVGLPVVAVLWANLHAGWVLIFLLGGAVVVGEIVDSRWRTPSAARIRDLVIALVIAAGAIALNPNGVDLYRYPLETAAIGALREFLAEWSPPDLGNIVGQLFWGFAFAAALPAIVLGRRRLRTADLLIGLGLTVMAASAARFVLVMPLVAAVGCLASVRLLEGSPLSIVLARMGRPPRTARLAAVNTALIGVILAAGAAVSFARVGPAAQLDAVAVHMPVAAVDWLLAHPSGERPFNTYSWGGYLGLRRPELPIYIDGRSDIYGDGPIRDYASVVQLESDPADLLTANDIDHVVFNTHSALAGWLDVRPEWRIGYRDDVATVWVRRQ